MAVLQRRQEATTSLQTEIASLRGVLQDWQRQQVELKDSLKKLLFALGPETPLCQANPKVDLPTPIRPDTGANAETKLNPLVIMSLNLQYYASYPDNLSRAADKLREAVAGPKPPDIICVQEGLCDWDVLDQVGFDLCICAGKRGHAQSVRQMVYDDAVALKAAKPETHEMLLCNQFYIRRGTSWLVEDIGSERVSSNLELKGGGNRVEATLAIRSMVWLKLRKIRNSGPSVYVMCTHITGGRFEDQYFVQQLASERRRQPERCDRFFRHLRPNPHPDDVGILVGDFNATEKYEPDGAMHGYFKYGIASSEGVKQDAKVAGLQTEAALEEHFKAYMTSPFKALRKCGWTFAYGDEVGSTSAFGHLIDHMALSRPVKVGSAEVVYLTNQKGGGKPSDTDVVITDHNAVKVTLLV